MYEREPSAAEPALQAALAAIGARSWTELVGVRLAWARGQTWLQLGEAFVPTPLTVAELNQALGQRRGAALDPDWLPSGEEVLALVEQATVARVIRTTESLHHLSLDQPGPEIIYSGTIGARGIAHFRIPQWEPAGFTFYANLERADGADFVRMQLVLTTRTITVEVIDDGWFEVAARLG